MSKQLSATMAEALGEATDHGGKLIRLAGGFWTYAGCPRRPHDGTPVWWVGTPTVRALVARGELAVTEWKKGGIRAFPIEASIPPNKGETL